MRLRIVAIAFGFALVAAACGTESSSDVAAGSAVSEASSTIAESTTTSSASTTITEPLATTTTEQPLDPALLHPCAAPVEADLGAWTVEALDATDVPRTIACGPSERIWIHRIRVGVTSIHIARDTEGSLGRVHYDGGGEPKGNESLVVFHTFTTVDYVTDRNRPSRHV